MHKRLAPTMTPMTMTPMTMGFLYYKGLPLAIYTKQKEASAGDLYKTKKEASVCGNLSFEWLGYPDSNQERQDQNLQCYHYTIPQTEILCRSKSLICGCKGSAFF